MLTAFLYDRCFPHIVNLCVQAGLKALPDVDMLIADLHESGHDVTPEDEQYIGALKTDLVRRTWSFVSDTRVLGLCRKDLEQAIKASNKNRLFGDDVDMKPDSALLRNMDVWWFSTYLMVDQFLKLSPVRGDDIYFWDCS